MNLDTLFPRKTLGFFPSPLHKLERMSNALGVEIWAKRDDVSSGLAFGGNKIRKLEWLVADALAQGCDTLVSIGGIQSNHTRQVTAAAAAVGMKSYTVQETWAEWDDPVYDKVGNILLTRMMGGNPIIDGYGYSTSQKDTWERALESVRQQGGKPYPIPAGASDHPLGGLGYANFADEVTMQEEKLGIFFDTVIVATCTGSTQAGMVVGFAGQKRRRRIIGIDTADDAAMTRRAVTQITHATADLIAAKGGKRIAISDSDIEIDSRYSAPAYGLPSRQTIDAIRMAAEMEAMITDPVYEGKSMAGLIDLCRQGEFNRGSRVLYVHLGGAPAVNAYYKAFEDENSLTTLAREARYQERDASVE
ncbi:MAG TPA: 1-aminocyclopropane-1-carboxylate deaminase [Noviherbaspirillum sp.]|nr:1-aminocyclopropane-1-carboxylate deaminase [Noviherbaspirillum sp.]